MTMLAYMSPRSTSERRIEALLTEGDRLIFPALAQRDREARDRLHVITHELLHDLGYNGADLGRRWNRGRQAISVWKKKGAMLRRQNGDGTG